VELQYSDEIDSTTEVVSHFYEYSVIPVAPNQFSQIGNEVGELLNKLNQLPLESVAVSTQAVLVETKKTLMKVQKLPLESMANNANETLEQTNKMLSGLTQSVASLEGILADVDQTQLPVEMSKTLRSVNAVLLDLKPLVLQMRNKPNSLIFGDQAVETIEPKKRQ